MLSYISGELKMSVIYCSIKIFTSEENGEICAICRKKLKKDDLIIQCPNCSTFFHYNHLQEWLKANSECPVCKNTLIVLMPEDEDIDIADQSKGDSLEISKIEGVLKEDNKIVFFNPILKPRISSIIVQILILTVGFIFFIFSISDFAYNLKSAISQPAIIIWWQIVFFLPFFLISLFIIFLGFVNNKIFFSSNWQNMELNDNKIVVTSKKIPKEIELFPDKIKSILIETYEEEFEDTSEVIEDLFCLCLEITYEKGKKYHFKRIFEDISSTKTERVALMLEEFLMAKYSIQILAFSDEMKKKKERIRILYIIIGSILLIGVILTRTWSFGLF